MQREYHFNTFIKGLIDVLNSDRVTDRVSSKDTTIFGLGLKNTAKICHN